MIDKFKGLEGKIRRDLEVLKKTPESNVVAIEVYERILQWIKELNALEVVEQRQMIV